MARTPGALKLIRWLLRAVIVLGAVASSEGLFAQLQANRDAPYSLSQDELNRSLQEINVLLQKGLLLQAKENYRLLLSHELAGEDRQSVQRALEALNMKILFSPTPTPDSFVYTVAPGDSLYEIAQKHHTTVELIKRMNHLTRDVIRAGEPLKISKAGYSIHIDKSDNRLTLYSDDEPLKTYPVATGRNHSTPIGTFTIEHKLIDPVWYQAGAVVPSSSPDNILGTRWLGFSMSGYGIHGTTLPETIGKHDTQGCIRMYNHDVEELYAIVPVKTTVVIAD